MDEDIQTVLTKPHRDVMIELENRGFGVMEELDFPPYRVDLYLPNYHLAIEVDGPLHNKREDEKRDNNLLDEYQLFVFRISSRHLNPNYWLGALEDILVEAIKTRDERWEQAELKLPWI